MWEQHHHRNNHRRQNDGAALWPRREENDPLHTGVVWPGLELPPWQGDIGQKNQGGREEPGNNENSCPGTLKTASGHGQEENRDGSRG